MGWERFIKKREREIDASLLGPWRSSPSECAWYLGALNRELLNMATSFRKHLKFADGINLYWVAPDRRGVKQYLENFAKGIGLPQLSLYKLAKLLSMASKACKFDAKLSQHLEQLSKQAMEDYTRIRLEFTPQLLRESLATMDTTRMVDAIEKINETLQRWAENIYQLTAWAFEEAEKTAKTRELARKLTK